MLTTAITFAIAKHQGQTRKASGLPYVTHTLTVMDMIQQHKGDSKNIEALQAAAVLHDTLEDTNTTFAELELNFGFMVASIVQELTSDEEQIRLIGKKDYLKKKMLSLTPYAFILKLLDRLSNCLDNPTQKYLADTIETLDFLLTNRQGLTARQLRIMGQIREVCVA